jgi:hypothetical protein
MLLRHGTQTAQFPNTQQGTPQKRGCFGVAAIEGWTLDGDP